MRTLTYVFGVVFFFCLWAPGSLGWLYDAHYWRFGFPGGWHGVQLYDTQQQHQYQQTREQTSQPQSGTATVNQNSFVGDPLLRTGIAGYAHPRSHFESGNNPSAAAKQGGQESLTQNQRGNGATQQWGQEPLTQNQRGRAATQQWRAQLLSQRGNAAAFKKQTGETRGWQNRQPNVGEPPVKSREGKFDFRARSGQVLTLSSSTGQRIEFVAKPGMTIELVGRSIPGTKSQTLGSATSGVGQTGQVSDVRAGRGTEKPGLAVDRGSQQGQWYALAAKHTPKNKVAFYHGSTTTSQRDQGTATAFGNGRTGQGAYRGSGSGRSEVKSYPADAQPEIGARNSIGIRSRANSATQREQRLDMAVALAQGIGFSKQPEQSTRFMRQPEQGAAFLTQREQGTGFVGQPEQGTRFARPPEQNTGPPGQPEQGAGIPRRRAQSIGPVRQSEQGTDLARQNRQGTQMNPHELGTIFDGRRDTGTNSNFAKQRGREETVLVVQREQSSTGQRDVQPNTTQSTREASQSRQGFNLPTQAVEVLLEPLPPFGFPIFTNLIQALKSAPGIKFASQGGQITASGSQRAQGIDLVPQGGQITASGSQRAQGIDLVPQGGQITASGSQRAQGIDLVPQNGQITKSSSQLGSANELAPQGGLITDVGGQPAQGQTTESADQPAQGQITESAGQPAHGQTTQSIGQPVQAHSTESLVQPARGQITESAGQPTQEQITELAGRPAQRQITESAGQPAQGQITESIGQPALGQITESVGQPTQGQPVESAGQPAQGQITQSVGHPPPGIQFTPQGGKITQRAQGFEGTQLLQVSQTDTQRGQGSQTDAQSGHRSQTDTQRGQGSQTYTQRGQGSQTDAQSGPQFQTEKQRKRTIKRAIQHGQRSRMATQSRQGPLRISHREQGFMSKAQSGQGVEYGTGRGSQQRQGLRQLRPAVIQGIRQADQRFRQMVTDTGAPQTTQHSEELATNNPHGVESMTSPVNRAIEIEAAPSGQVLPRPPVTPYPQQAVQPRRGFPLQQRFPPQTDSSVPLAAFVKQHSKKVRILIKRTNEIYF
ncbi:uncharacterized protein LOC135476387 [Liolophura sinensis]|uniref:uncharacterized protein LOC135476387 n=1 Tax=Liolophura sinensis TaxID=3198878 RepID=UPI0031590931